MSSQTTTPGPWAWCWKHGSLHRVGPPPYRFGDTVLCQDDDGGTQISEADAALIKASPDLLSALKLVWDTYGMDPSVDSAIWQTVHAAIAKAKDVQNV